MLEGLAAGQHEHDDEGRPRLADEHRGSDRGDRQNIKAKIAT